MRKMIYLGILTILLGSCEIGLEPDTQGDTQSVSLYTSTVEMELGDSANISASAVAPVWRDEYITLKNDSIENYPETGQTTEWGVTELENGLYRVESSTVYPYSELLERTTEVYYVVDKDNSGTWSTNDYYADVDGAQNTTYRETYETTFTNGDVRVEQIQSDSTQIGFELNSDFFENDYGFASIVVYDQKSTVMDTSTARISGVRYYAEYDSGATRKTLIVETGNAVNLVTPDGVRRGRSTVEGRIEIVDTSTGRTVSGEYVFTLRDGSQLFYTLD